MVSFQHKLYKDNPTICSKDEWMDKSPSEHGNSEFMLSF